jgi:Domain of unknown function (DUF4124)
MKICYGVFVLLILWTAALTGAETYKWTDDKGTVSFTDDPALIPSRYRSNALTVKDASKRSLKAHKNIKKKKEKKRQSQPGTPQIVTSPDHAQSTPVSEGMQQTVKGHLGGDQTDPAPPSMKQPKPAPLGDQPKATPPGMKQPVSAPLGDQPKEAPSGMKQPVPEPLGDQPKVTPSGMEQPTPKY